MESWRETWRNGFAHVLPTGGLVALRDALKSDDVRLMQGCTTSPPPLMCTQDWPAEGGCCLAVVAVDDLGGWGVASVGDVEEFFARACFEADMKIGEAAACRWFLNWFDDTPRDEMRRELLAEVERTLAERGIDAAPEAR